MYVATVLHVKPIKSVVGSYDSVCSFIKTFDEKAGNPDKDAESVQVTSPFLYTILKTRACQCRNIVRRVFLPSQRVPLETTLCGLMSRWSTSHRQWR